MHLSIALAAAGLLASTLAVPHDHHSHHKHSMGYPYGSGYTGTVGAIATPGASHKYNMTEHGTIFKTKTLTVEVNEDAVSTASPPEQSLDESPSVPEDKHKASHNAAAATCDVQTVTVTNAETVTVTAGAEATPSTPSEPIVQSEPLVKAPKSVSHAPPASTPSPAAAGESTDNQSVKEVNSEPPSSSSVVPSSPPAAASSAAADDNTPAPKAAAQPKGLPFKTKRGVIASTNTMKIVAKNFGVGKVSWFGNWYSSPPDELSPNLQFVPQIYGTASDEKGVWTKNAQNAVAKGDKYFLSFGEPGPGNPDLSLRIDVPTAVKLWHDKVEPYTKQGVTIGSPCILQNDKDFDWLDQFMDACNDCTIGFVAVHWVYKADLEHVAEFKRTVEKAKTVADKKGVGVWVDNFYGSGSPDDQKAFLGETVPWLDEQDWVHAYAWVPSGHMTEGDALNDLGEYYANL